jgi:lambda repressor-like predicted transcriptional regulator
MPTGTRTGRAVRLVSSGGRAPAAQVDHQLAALLTRSLKWWARLQEQGITVTELARSENLTHAYVNSVLKLSFLAPDIVEAILAGTQPAMLSSQRLKATDFPISWKEQRETFGFAAA